ncbi:MAG: hypothetical protein GY947_01780 [Rhodobacteraceae bacterium]|nr:hypothetical protein [Paracoccaceae bacterium]
METMISFTPLLPMPILWALAAVAVLASVLAVWRDLPGWWMRGLAFAVLLLALAQPVFRQEERDPLSNIVFVVVDKTESQSVAVRPAQIDAAVAALTAKIGELEDFELRAVEVENDLQQADSGSLVLTALAKAASEVAETRIAGAVLVTDGQIHDPGFLEDFPAPVHILLTGEEQDWDRRLILRNVPAFAIVGEAVTLFLRIEDQGAVPDNLAGTARLEISIDGEPAQGFTVETGRDFELPLTLPHGGMNVLQFAVVPEDGELTKRNNAAVVAINGVRDRLRVLLVSGEPHAGERTWRNLLKSDSAVDLVHFTILRSPDKQDGVPVRELSLIAFPTRELFLEKIDEFDLIIFDRYRRRGILPNHYLENVAKYVRGGGAVLVASGPAFAGVDSLWRTPLASVLPGRPTAQVIEEGYVPRISDLGARHPVTEALEQFAPASAADDGTPGWGRWFRLIEAVPTAGNTVMTGPDDRPLLMLDRVEEGRIALLTSDHAWLWTRGFEGGGPQLELLRRLAHWMMKEPELEEEQITAIANGRQVLVTRRSLKEGNPEIAVEGPGGESFVLQPEEISPGRWQSEFTGLENGLYRLTDGEQNSVVAIGPIAPREFEQTIADDALLAPLAQATRGGSLRLETNPAPKIRLVRTGRVASGRGWIGLTPRHAYLATDIRQSPLVPGWVLLLLTGLLIVAAWRHEGQ